MTRMVDLALILGTSNMASPGTILGSCLRSFRKAPRNNRQTYRSGHSERLRKCAVVDPPIPLSRIFHSVGLCLGALLKVCVRPSSTSGRVERKAQRWR